MPAAPTSSRCSTSPASPAARGWRRARARRPVRRRGGGRLRRGGAGGEPGGGEARIEAIAPVDERDWVRLTQAQFGPIEIEPGFWIVPTWSDVPAGARAGDPARPRAWPSAPAPIPPPACACAGSSATARAGQHRGARARLRLRLGRAGDRRRRCIGAAAIDAVDIDPAAVETTRRQRLGQRGDACAPARPTSLGAERFDLVLANILATPLKLLAPLLSSRLAPAGTLVLSGILGSQADGVAGGLRALARARGRRTRTTAGS